MIFIERRSGGRSLGRQTRQGLTLMETLIGTGIFAISAFAIYLSFSNLIDLSSVTKRTSAAVAVIQAQLETVRNMKYSDVGIVGGSPPGKIPASQAVNYDGIPFVVNATVRNIDDPFDGTLGGTPNDTAPADYKLVEFQVICVACNQAIPLVITTRVAPKGLETTTQNGALFIKVFDAGGVAISNVNVSVVNTSTNPTILVNDVTDNNGMLQLVDIPTSTGGYRISVSKSGYSSAQSYPLGGAGNPNPITPHATVVAQAVTQVSLAIDRVSHLYFHTTNELCGSVGFASFSLTGAKLIGTAPNVVKYAVSTTTDANGNWVNSNLEWDSYAFQNLNSNLDIAGYTLVGASSSFDVDPSSTLDARWTLLPKNRPALLVTVLDQNGDQVADATVTLSKTGYTNTVLTGHHFYNMTDWSGGKYTATNGVEAEAYPGQLQLQPAGGPYPTSTLASLESQTIDLGTSTTSVYTLNWAPTSQDPATGANSVGFQVASNNDNTTWVYRGPDGTSNTYYTSPGVAIPGNSGSRYVRYKVFLQTADSNTTPTIDSVNLEYGSGCLAPGQVYLSGLSTGTYTVTVQKSGFQLATSSVTVGSGWQEAVVNLQP